MAELLMKAFDASNPDPVKDAATYKSDDIVMVAEDGFQWGDKDVIPPAEGGAFYIVKVPGVDPAEFAALDKADMLEVTYSLDPVDISGRLPVAADILAGIQARREESLKREFMLSRRVFKFDRSALTVDERNAISRDGVLVKSEAEARAILVNKLDGSKL